MFSVRPNGSKIALILFAELLAQSDFLMVDCQFHTEPLESMGGEKISWEEYDALLDRNPEVVKIDQDLWENADELHFC